MSVTTKRSGDDKRYARIKLTLSIAGMFADFVVIALFAFGGFSAPLAGRIALTVPGIYLQFVAFMAVMGLAVSTAGFPFDFFGSFVVEHRFGLSNQSLALWLWEKLKSAVVGSAIGLPLSLLFFLSLRVTGPDWWLWFGIIAVGASVLFARIAPAVIFPLFYKFTRLDDGETAARIAGLLESRGVRFEGIYTFNMSRDTKKVNAGFAGLGRGRRIILSDTLVRDFTPGEIAVVFAHELGHYKKNHLLKNLAVSSGIILVSFYLCGLAYAATIGMMGYGGVHEIPAIPVLLLYLSFFGFLIMPFTNTLSRRHEIQADLFALEASGDRDSFISTMEKLADTNLSDRDPNPLVEFIFHGHPSIAKRIAFARNWNRS